MKQQKTQGNFHVTRIGEQNHANHRERMRKRLLEHREHTIFDHELLEMLLYACMPRKDTNPLAHRLLNQFGSLHKVLGADIRELLEVEGMGENAALHLHLVFISMCRCQMSLITGADVRKAVRTPSEMGSFFVVRMRKYVEETVVVACLDAKCHIKTCRELCTGTPTATDVQAYQIAQMAMECHAATVVLAHNHPDGSCMPSAADLRTTVALREKLLGVGVDLVEHVVVGENRYMLLSDLGVFEDTPAELPED